MSFADYGFDIFPYSGHNQNCGEVPKCTREHDTFDIGELDDLGNICYHVIDHLVDLGIHTENELTLAKQELEKYKGQQEQPVENSELAVYKSEDEKLIENTNLDCENQSFSVEYEGKKSQSVGKSPQNSGTKNSSWNFPGFSLFKKTPKTPTEPEAHVRFQSEDERPSEPNNSEAFNQSCEESDAAARSDLDKEVNCSILSDDSFRSVIIEKDSEIISLKNENAVKDVELKELENHNKKLEVMIGKLKKDIELLEGASRVCTISEVELQELIRKKNEEVHFARQSSVKLERELKDERQARKHEERELHHLRNFVMETQRCHKSITDELKLSKRRLEALESSNASYAATIKLLQQERDELDKLNNDQEVEIEKLLNIVQRLHEKYDRTKEELYTANEELMSREQQVEQCRQQLETTEQEVSELVADLAECLGKVTRCGKSVSETRVCSTAHRTASERRREVYAQAREMTRALDSIVQEHISCHEHRADLMREIERLRNMDGPWKKARSIQAELSSDAMTEDARSELTDMEFDLTSRLTSRRGSFNREGVETALSIEMNMREIVEEIFDQVVDEEWIVAEAELMAEEARREARREEEMLYQESERAKLEELNRKCKQFLLQQMENLENALGEIEKVVDGFGFKALEGESVAVLKVENDDDDEFLKLNNEFSTTVLQRLRDFTRIIVRVTSHLRIGSDANGAYLKKVEQKIEETLNLMRETELEKQQLTSELQESKKKCEDLTNKILSLEENLSSKSSELIALTDSKKSKHDAWQSEVETLRKQLTTIEKKLLESRSENSSLLKKSDELIESLRGEIKAKNDKLREYGKHNDFLNEKLLESKEMIEKLHRTIAQENELKSEYANFEALHEQIRGLISEKEGLVQKMSSMAAQLEKYEQGTADMQANFDRIVEDNEYLEQCIVTFKAENERLEMSLANKQGLKLQVGTKFDELLQKIEKIVKTTKKPSSRPPSSVGRSRSVTSRPRSPPKLQTSSQSLSDVMIQGLQKDLQSNMEKLRAQQVELAEKEKEIADKNQRIEALNTQIVKVKASVSSDNHAILKRVEVLIREKAELRNELKQTLTKYEDKLQEMHKQYKHNELELHKNHNESIKRLEAKYADIIKEEENPFNNDSWIDSLSVSELQKIHDKVCLSLAKPRGSIDNRKSKASLMNSMSKRNLSSMKKDGKGMKTSSAPRPVSKDGPGLKTSASINVMTKDHHSMMTRSRKY